MKLEYVYVAGYKNLINTTLAFETGEIPITIIGNNGTGKSNLVEALLHIFVGLYYGRPPEFDFLRLAIRNGGHSLRDKLRALL